MKVVEDRSIMSKEYRFPPTLQRGLSAIGELLVGCCPRWQKKTSAPELGVNSPTLPHKLCLWCIYRKLVNVATANALQLEAAGATPVLSRFNYDAMEIR